MSDFFMGLELSASSTRRFFLSKNPIEFFPFTETLQNPVKLTAPDPSSISVYSHKRERERGTTSFQASSVVASAKLEEEEEQQGEAEVAEGYTLTQFCDKMIDVFLDEKPKIKEWRKFLVFRDEWNKYRACFYSRCQS